MAKRTIQEQISQAERIQQLLMDRWEDLLSGKATDAEGNVIPISAAEAGIIAKWLKESGVMLDPTKLPTPLRDKLMDNVDPSQVTGDDLPTRAD